MAWTQSLSEALTVKLRSPGPRAARGGARAFTDDQKIVGLQPRRSVWKLTSVTVVSIRIGGMARTRSCASQ